MVLSTPFLIGNEALSNNTFTCGEGFLLIRLVGSDTETPTTH